MDKKLRISILCSIIIITMIFGSITFSESVNPFQKYVKIGLETPVYSDKYVNLYSTAGFSLMTLNNEFQKVFDITSTTIFVRLDYYLNDYKTETGPYHIQLNNNYSSYQDAKAQLTQLKNKNINAFPYYSNGTFRIWIGQFTNQQSALNCINQIKSNIEGELEVVQPNKRRIFIDDFGGQVILAFDKDANVFIGSTNDSELFSIVQVENKKYRGYITFNRVEDKLITINYVNLELYLYGVVPREMSGSWPLEALKAQAVAARNYALMRLGSHSHEGYDLCDTTHCQVYGGYDSESINSNRAVIETLNKTLTYNGQLISTYYHSSSGGRTEDSENVWSGVVPYLRGVEDEFSLGAPNDNWKLIMSESEIKETLDENGIDVGDIIAIKPVEYSDSGRVIKLAIIGKEGIHFLENEKSRAILGYNSLKSTMYEVESQGGVHVIGANSSSPKIISLDQATIISASGVDTPNRGSDRDNINKMQVFNGSQVKSISNPTIEYVFSGSGWGHGLGMSQWGAKKMAEEGYTFEEILQHYYTGTKVE